MREFPSNAAVFFFCFFLQITGTIRSEVEILEKCHSCSVILEMTISIKAKFNKSDIISVRDVQAFYFEVSKMKGF